MLNRTEQTTTREQRARPEVAGPVHLFVCFACVSFCSFSLPLGAGDLLIQNEDFLDPDSFASEYALTIMHFRKCTVNHFSQSYTCFMQFIFCSFDQC